MRYRSRGIVRSLLPLGPGALAASPRSQFVRFVAVGGMLVGTFGVAAFDAATPASAADSPIEQRGPGHVTSDPLPTVQINGVVWDQTVIGNRVYAVGSFTRARPAGSAPGQNEVPRANILAYDITSGELDTGFNARLNAEATTVVASPDGSSLYIGGTFTSVNGLTRQRIAALDPVTGALKPGFNAAVDYRVNVLVADDDTLYAGGAFSTAHGVWRARLAAFSASTGALLMWAPRADAEVHAMTLTPDGTKVIVGGKFGTLNGVQARASGALDALSGSTLPWAMNGIVYPWGPEAAILDLSTDGTSIFGNAYHLPAAVVNTRWEGVFSADPDTGVLNWINDCHGDTYAHAEMNGYVFAVGHAHYCGNLGGFPQSQNWSTNMRHATSTTAHATGTLRPDLWGYASYPGMPAPSMVNWAPEWEVGSYTTAGMAGWTVESTDQYLLIGGEFVGVNQQNQQGLVRFAIEGLAPARDGPRLGGANFVPQFRSFAAGEVRVSFVSNYDRDDTALTYDVIRDGDNGTPVYSTTRNSTSWNRPTIGFTDTGLEPGSRHSYRVRATDSNGNVAWGNNISVVVAGAGSPSPYADVVMADGPTFHWRFEEPAGTTGSAVDWVAGSNGWINSAVTRGEPGAIIADGDGSFRFGEADTAIVYEPVAVLRKPVIDTYSLEAWVRTTDSDGGRIIGFSGNATGPSSSSQSDRHIYMTNDGAVHFGIRQSGTRLTVSGGPGLNDGQWHHLVGTHGDAGLALYIDGDLVGARADALSGDNYYGYWRVGSDVLTDWPGLHSTNAFEGWIDEVAVYEYHVLTPTRVLAHYDTSGYGTGNLMPRAEFTATRTLSDVAFDGSGSSDRDGTIVDYSWDFGDGSPAGSGVAPSHRYAADGTYTVTLRVTDDDGATGRLSHDVTLAEADDFTPLIPARLLDTRPDGVTADGQHRATGRVPAGRTYELPVTGRGSVAVDASAVVLNVTAVSPDAPGFLTVWPCGVPMPLASSVNYLTGQVVPNAVITQVGTDGNVCIFTRAQTDLVVDVTGNYPDTTSFTPLIPARLLDTRPDGVTADGQHRATGRVPAGRTYELPVTGRGSVAVDASAVVLNVTAVSPDAPGFLTVWPCGVPMPLASSVNYLAGQVVPNAVITQVGTDGNVCIFTRAQTDLVVDVTGNYPAQR